jgi:hypothetical protein
MARKITRRQTRRRRFGTLLACLTSVGIGLLLLWLVAGLAGSTLVNPRPGSARTSEADGAPSETSGALRVPSGPQTYDVRGAPSVSVAVINQVLSDYGSPLAGQGQALYDLGVRYGIDPAFCLAFFVHESAAGTRGEAVLTQSVGNIRATAGAPSLDGYRLYPTWLAGAEDWFRLIAGLYVRDWQRTTVDQIIPVYAPSGDNNDVQAYVDDVEQLVTAWRAQSL